MAFTKRPDAPTAEGFSGVPNEPLKSFSSAGFDTNVGKNEAFIQNDQQRTLKSIFNQNTAGPLSRQTGAARLVDLYDKTVKMFKSVDSSSLVFNVLKLDNQQHNVFVSSVLVVGRDKANQDRAYVYSLLIEREQSIEPEVKTQPGGYKTVIPVTSSNAWDSKYSAVVEQVVADALNIPQKSVYAFSACIVPKELDLGNENQDLTTKITQDFQNMMYNVAYAINTRIQEDNGISGFILSSTSPNEVMTIEPKFSRSLTKDNGGREMRGDIELTFSLKQHNKQGQSLNGSDMTSKIFGTQTGYMDFIPIVKENNMGSGWGNNQQFVQKFNPLYVITSMFTNQAGTLHAHLTMLMAAATMANGDEWVNSMFERHQASKRSGEKIDMGEIGALNIEVNLPEFRSPDAQGLNNSFGPIIDTRVADFDKNKYASLIQRLCNQDMYIAIDAPNVGAESWYMDIFRQSSYSTTQAKVFSDRIFKALQELTDNRFGAALNSITSNTRLWLTDVPCTIHNGYYLSHNQERRDIRDVDTLTIANILGPSDPLAPARWGATFMPGADPEKALTERKEMIEQVCGGSSNVVYTGYSTRLFLNPAIIKAMLMCSADLGFNIRFSSAYNTGFNVFGAGGFNFGNTQGLNSSNVGSTFRGNFGGGTFGNVINTNNYFNNNGLKL